MDPVIHEPVLVKEVLHYLSPGPEGCYVDCNLGMGGHVIALLNLLKDLGRGRAQVIGIDADPKAPPAARKRIADAGLDPAHVEILVGNHSELDTLLARAVRQPLLGVLWDLGPSTPQILSMDRGFSWESDDPLDMRYNQQGEGPTAEEIVNTWSEEDLADLIWRRGDEKFSRRIARRIVEARERRPVRTGRELARVVQDAVPKAAWPPKTHVASRTFLALRMEVTRELESFEASLPKALELLAPGGRLVVIAFDGNQDVIAKRFFKEMSQPKVEAPWPMPQAGSEVPARLKVLTGRPVTPSEEEISRNPRSRSARLRAAEKIG